ncbi:alpha-2-macroglobulin family protein [Hymenobacter convexus]|uniref:alpha-2-macroglobulin family protein n=1 Tax=Hymenobacter sp. CA1UV-4 TaxID=3063782 RepID=UPI002712233F|nr:MG2 domain-containing protein [Hymenobacter sp. CA1UV-4]MDO7854649.1 MG2 domain-containing protein [Hymenobacter sp. CA1UV-4]
MRFLLFACLLLTMFFSADSASPPPSGPYAARWKKIDALLAKNQTATAAPLVQAIYQQAKKAGDDPAYVRALLYKIRLLQAREEDDTEKSIGLLETELKTATFPARPILHSLLAELYVNYLNQNRYRLYQRTAGAKPTLDDQKTADGGTGLATWDMGRLGTAIVRHYYQSVEDEPQRQLKTTLAQLGDLATAGDAEGRALRPTLYDLLAQRAIEGLKNEELYITKPEQQFQLIEPKLFGTAQEFAALKLTAPAGDSLNGQFHALQLLQRLTAARQQASLVGTAPQVLAALADVDLLRLDYLDGLAEGTDLAAQYLPALERMAETYKPLPISTEFMARRAEAIREAGDNVAAVQLAREAEARFPKSRGAARARQLRAEIEMPEVAFSAAEVVVPNQPWRLDVVARNATSLHAWAYRIPLKAWQAGDENDGRPVAKRYARALRAAPATSWAVPAPAHAQDYKDQKFAVAGAALPAGYYVVLISNQATEPLGKRAGTVTASALVAVSSLSATWRKNPDNGETNLLVLNRQSGQLLAGAKAQGRYGRYISKLNRTTYRLGAARVSDAGGRTTLPAPEAGPAGSNTEILEGAWLTQGNDSLWLPISNPYLGPMKQRAMPPQRRIFLFTDRAIYRPGQTVYFKGIFTESQNGKAHLLKNEPGSVRLLDVNGQTVQTRDFTTSDFGSFNNSLVLPAGLLNGEFQLRTDHGGISIAVEDYKRPTFLVSIDSVPGRPQLGQPLTVGGRARAYAGPATDGATVSYRVTRRELFPLFDYGYGGRGRYLPGGNRGTQEIAHGTATTDAEGRFSITFTPPLVPKPTGRRWEPGYLFEITADVTDAAGETRTGTRSVSIGRNPLSLQLTGPDEVDKQHLPAFRLLSTNATGEPLPATGTLRLLARRYRPNPPGVPGPAPETEENELPAELVKTLAFDTKTSPVLDLQAALAALPTGRYRLEAFAAETDTARHDFTLYDSQAATVPFATPDWFVATADTVAPGQSATLLLGSSEADARILLEVEREGQLLRSEWLTLRANEQRRLSIESGSATAVGPLYIHTLQVRDGRLYRHDAIVQVTEKPQPLRLSIATFRDKLQPGQKETWRVSIHQANGQPATAELLATLYDQSLDVFRPHSFMGLDFGRAYYPARFGWMGDFEEVNSTEIIQPGNSDSAGGNSLDEKNYPTLKTWADFEAKADYIKAYVVADMESKSADDRPGNARMMMAAPAPMASGVRMASQKQGVASSVGSGYVGPSAMVSQQKEPAAPNLSAVPTRSDFRETAFWMPALHTDKNGDVVLEFQMPEAVTRWQLLALAHDQSLHCGQLARQLVTQKEIQITPNAPRFLRQGDTFTFPAKFSNLTDHATSGTAQLFLLDAATGQDLTSQLLKGPAQQSVSAAAHQSTPLGWELSLPSDFAPAAVTYRVVAQAGDKEEGKGDKKSKKKGRQAPLSAGNATEHSSGTGVRFSDGEENTLPVLPNRILLTESLPLPIVGPGTRTFELSKLTSSNSTTRRNYSLTLEMTANPAWYAVQSLPYLMEYPYECSEQTFSRLYANLLAAQILRANPRFKTVLAEWTRQAQSGTPAQKNALSSQLAQNQELKNLLLQETPWVRDAQGETERLARLTELFGETRLAGETSRALLKLRKMQLPSGAFPWFEKMPDDRYITQLIVAGFGKLKKLGAFDAEKDDTGREILTNALRYLDAALADDYARLRKTKNVKLAENHLDDEQIQALYARSFWPQPAEAASAKASFAYYREQAAKYWPAQTRYLQAQTALALFRHDAKAPAAAEILRGLSENALHSPELGMYWKEVRGGYYWREAPAETQATLIEAFDEVRHDQKAVDEMKLWLLKQKQAHSWESTRATADACYALLLRGSDWLTPAQPLQITVGGQSVKPEAAQAGTGYFKTSWPAAEVLPAQGKVTVNKPDAGVAWGALYWQYFEDLDKVTAAATPLSLERELYRETRTAGGPVLEKLTATSPLKIGDALVVRLVLRTDRALEYVHLKDQRAAGLEPIAQTSGYRYQNGLGYYESPRDAATNFFLSEVPRGTHVFEYRLRASQAGDFSGGLSQVQCLYAPEFGAHSAGGRLRIAR